MLKTKPLLYLLKHAFLDETVGPGLFYCPYCMQVEGMLSAYPQLREELEIIYVDFEKPRGQLADFSGQENQSCPQLIFAEGDDARSSQWTVTARNGARRIDQTADIMQYLSEHFALPQRHP